MPNNCETLTEKEHCWLSTFLHSRLPPRKREFAQMSQTVKGKQIGSRIIIILEATNIEKMLLIKSWKTGKDV